MINNITCKYFDAIIIGSGGAGLMTAISCYDNGVKNIAIISKVNPVNSHTVSAKGGINASLGNVEKDDWRWHAYDTLKGSAFLADDDAVEVLCKNANDAILFLEKNGVVFSRDDKNKIAQRAYGGQTTNFGEGGIAYRACYSKDNTGQTILHTLHQQAIKRSVSFFNEFFVVELLTQDQECFGCLAVDLNSGSLNLFIAKMTILATGGYSQIYFNTTSSTICTGDGTALALKAGYNLQDMEFVQFHPTGIYGLGFLISEATRGEGGYLLNKNNYRFMQDYSPKMMELSSRDIISQSMAKELAKGNGGGENSDYLYLDIRHLSPETLENKLPGVVELVKKFCKIDPQNQLIPITPSAHYSMGGIECDINCLVSKGLMAVGEVACHSVHGANRLGCNSLLDLVVFGKIAGEKLVDNINSKIHDNLKVDKISSQLIKKFWDNFEHDILKVNRQNPKKINEIKLQMQKNNDRTLGVFRNHDLILEGLNLNIALLKQIKQIKISSTNLIWNEELIQYYELENLLLNSISVGFCALNRKESRGSHYRSDFLKTDSNFLAHSLCKIDESSEYFMKYSLKPVRNSKKFF
jgi:succinate dehydrogenase/fumarate reductase flavoprotein subunit